MVQFYDTILYSTNHRRWDNSVSSAKGHGLDGWKSIPWRGEKFFSSCSPPSLLFNGNWGLFAPEGKVLLHEADHSLPSNAKAKNGGHISPFLHMSG
jgi:hypothetical protein